MFQNTYTNVAEEKTTNQAETLLHSLERAAAGIGLHVNANKTEYMCYNQTGNIATLDGASLKLVNKFTYLGSSVSSTEKDIDTRLTKAWTAIDRLSIIWKSDLTDKMKRSFFQAAVVSILLYGCTTWTLTKRLERRLDGNYTRMLRAVLNKSWRQHPTRLQLYGHLPPITKTIQVRRTRHAGHCWRSKDELISDVLLWTPTHGCARVGRPARTYIQQLCEDTGCNPEDLPEAMNDREKWRETVRDIRAGGATWWWWWYQCSRGKLNISKRLYQCSRGKLNISKHLYQCSRGKLNISKHLYQCSRGKLNISKHLYQCSRGKLNVSKHLYQCSRGKLNVSKRLYQCSRGKLNVSKRLYQCSRGKLNVSKHLYQCSRGKLNVSKRLYQCSRGKFNIMPIYQNNDYTQLQIKERNFIDKFKPKLNKTWTIHTQKRL